MPVDDVAGSICKALSGDFTGAAVSSCDRVAIAAGQGGY